MNNKRDVDPTEQEDRDRVEEFKEASKNKSWFDPNRVKIPKPENWVPDPVFPPGHQKAGTARCLQWNYNTGKQCGKSPVKGRTKCRTHGGATKRGAASHLYTGGGDGRYSSSIVNNPELSNAYQAALKQRNLLSLSPNIAMTDAQLNLLYQDYYYTSKDVIKFMSSLVTLWTQIKLSLPRSSPPDLREKVLLADSLIMSLHSLMQEKETFDKREEELVERRRKLTESEVKHQLGTKEVIMKGEVVGLFATVGTAFRQLILERVEDRKLQRDVLDGFIKIIEGEIVGRLEPRSSNG